MGVPAMKNQKVPQLLLGVTATLALGSVHAANGYDWTGFYGL